MPICCGTITRTPILFLHFCYSLTKMGLMGLEDMPLRIWLSFRSPGSTTLRGWWRSDECVNSVRKGLRAKGSAALWTIEEPILIVDFTIILQSFTATEF